MTEKNKKKIENKKQRNLWTMNPRTRVKESKKKYKRNVQKTLDKKEFM